MEELRLSAVATRVVAWHNRHPLARRITASQVHAIGYVALPFSDPRGAAFAPAPADQPAPADEPAQGGTLRERAQARSRQQQAAGAPAGVPTVTQLAVNHQHLTADFSENFIDPLTPRQVERFARRQGQALVRAPADGPLRRVRADGGQPGGGLTLYLLTAVIETGTRKSRVLLGGGNTPAVLGLRVLAPARAVAAVLPLMAAGVAALLMNRPVGPAPLAAVVPPLAAASAASAAVPAAVPASRPAPAAQVAAAPASAAWAASAPTALAPVASAPLVTMAAPEPPASAPLDVEPRLGRIDMPSIRPQLGPHLKPQPGAASPAPATATAAPAPAPLPTVAAFALSTRLLRTRAEADQVRIAMKSLLKAVNATEVRVDVMPVGDDWRVVGMPFASRGDADKARALLVSRGMRVDVIGF